ncbi:hypothetical protein ACVMB0_000037 [Bradyrhizobium sp. USDA 4451]
MRRSVPIRTSADWNDPASGFVEADLVAHSDPSARGSFIQTLVLTDIATGWTECAPLIVREQTLLSTVSTELRKQLPYALLGRDTDNDTVFMNETLKAYCDAGNIVFTRCRPYRKNDQAFVEQKNGAVVRRMIGYRRFEGLEAATLLAELYRSARLFVNFFQPSFKLIAKQRDGARVRNVQRADNATPALGCRRSHLRRGSRPSPGNLCRPRPGRVAARYPRRTGAPRGARGYTANRPSCCGNAIDRSLSGKPTNRLEGRSYATDGSANRESEKRPAPSRPAHQSNARFAKMV